MILRCLILDLETSTLELESPIVEVGAILYSVVNQTSLAEFSSLLPAPRNDAQAINRIKKAALKEASKLESFSVLGIKERLALMIADSDLLVSHHADFDKPRFREWFFEGISTRPDLGLKLEHALARPWVCTMEDFKWPNAGKQQGSLVHLALDHGVGVETAHRALTDCRLISRLFDQMEDLSEMFRVALRPKAIFVGNQVFDDNQIAKDHGFKWDRLVQGKWARRMAIEDASELPFPVEQITEGKASR